MALKNVQGDTALILSAQGAATVTSGAVAPAGMAANVMLLVHVSAVSGSPTLNASLEESNDGTTWTAITGSSITQISGTGNGSANAVTSKAYVRVTATVAGTTPSVTGRAVLLIIPN